MEKWSALDLGVALKGEPLARWLPLRPTATDGASCMHLFVPTDSAISGRVGPASFERGKTYAEGGKVLGMRLRGRELSARVQGRQRAPYRVEVELGEDAISYAWCSCPVGEEGRCKHVAALLWHWQGEADAPAPGAYGQAAAPQILPPPRVGRGDDAEDGPSGLSLRMSVEEVLEWAERHEVTDWAHRPVSVLRGRDLPAYYLWGPELDHPPTLSQVIAGVRPGSRDLRGASRWATSLRRAAVDVLRGAAADVARANAWEEKAELWRAIPPEDPDLKQVWADLRQARAELRALTPPRLTEENPTPAPMIFHEDPPTFTYNEDVVMWCGGGRIPTLTVNLQPTADELIVACDCTRGDGRCAMVLTAMDLALDQLTQKQASEVTRAAARALKIPRWQRALNRLDLALAELPQEPEGVEQGGQAFGWRILPTSRGLNLEPVMLTRYKTRGGYRSARQDAEELLESGYVFPEAADREVLQLMARVEDADSDRDLVMVALSLLEGHPRVVLKDGGLVTLRRATFGWDITEEGDAVELTVSIGGKPVQPSQVLAQVGRDGGGGLVAYLDDEKRICYLSEISGPAHKALRVLAKRGSRYPSEATPQLMERVRSLSVVGEVRLGSSLRGDAVAPLPDMVICLEALGEGALAVEPRLRPLPGAGLVVAGEPPELLYGAVGERRVYVRRDRGAEVARLEELMETWPGVPGGRRRRFVLTEAEDALAFLGILRVQAASPHMEVRWTGRPRRLSTASAADVRLRVSGQRDWLAVEGGIELDGQSVALAALLEAIREGRKYVPVGDGDWIELTQTLSAQLEPLAGVAWSSRRGVEMSPLAASILDDYDGWNLELDLGERWTGWLARVRESERLPVPIPPNLNAELRPYQIDGVKWLIRMAHWSPGACLADDMGLGKTIQALALLLHRVDEGPALVIAPTSVGFNWERETHRFAPSLEVLSYRGPERGALLKNLKPGQILITSYDLLSRDGDELADVLWGTVVLDEAQALKNAATQRARAARRLNAGFALALTGTPIENRVGELWSLFRILAPGLMGSSERFRERFVVPIERLEDVKARGVLSRLIRPFILRRLKSEVALDLPPRTEEVVEVALSKGEGILYNALRLSALRELEEEKGEGDGNRFSIFAALTRLRQAACHPRLVDPDSVLPSAKLIALMELVDELRDGGHRALIFSQFTRHLALVREALDARGITYRYLDGSTPAASRAHEVDAFQAGEGDLFLISLKAGGSGLNLTAASYVIHMDPWWNPAVEDQATDRAHRIGQTEPVTVYRLVARGTIEERILALHDEKRNLVAGILGGAGAASSLSTDELVGIIRGDGEVPLVDEDDLPAQPRLGAERASTVDPPAASPAPHMLTMVPASQPSSPEPAAVPIPPEAGSSEPDDAETSALEALKVALSDMLQAELRSGALTKPATARNYEKAGHRLLSYIAREGGALVQQADLDLWSARYLKAVQAGEIRRARSDLVYGKPAFSRLGELLKRRSV